MFIWHFVQQSVHTLVSSGNKVHIPWPLKNKEVVHMPLVHRQQLGFAVQVVPWEVKTQSLMKVHGRFLLPERLADLSKLLGNTGARNALCL